MKYCRCNRCGHLAPAKEFEELDVMKYTYPPEEESATSATYPDRGKSAEITPNTVDLCGSCRADLHDFFRNVTVNRRQSD